MKSEDLVADYLLRAKGRLKALDTLYDEKLWADVVRESQEVVELSLKALLRHHRIEVPRVHDVGGVLESNRDRLDPLIQEKLSEIVDISHDLRRDRELAFYGSEDITPNTFYKEKHAKEARERAGKIVSLCLKVAGSS